MAYNITHGQSKIGGKGTPTYRTWVSMRARCRDKTNADYGAKGISVCERWEVFANFLEDMGCRPNGRTLDRIDPDGDYNKENCRWASIVQQNRNKSNNILVELDGELKCIAEWAEEYNLPFSTVYSRLRKGWSAEKSIKTPMMFRGELHYSKRHPENIKKGEDKRSSKITDDKARDIFSRYKDGNVSQRVLAEEHGISSFTVSCICRRTKWKHATEGIK